MPLSNVARPLENPATNCSRATKASILRRCRCGCLVLIIIRSLLFAYYYLLVIIRLLLFGARAELPHILQPTRPVCTKQPQHHPRLRRATCEQLELQVLFHGTSWQWSRLYSRTRDESDVQPRAQRCPLNMGCTLVGSKGLSAFYGRTSTGGEDTMRECYCDSYKLS